MAMFDKKEPPPARPNPLPPPSPPPRTRVEAKDSAKPSTAPPAKASNIGESIIVKGDITGSEDIRVSGTVEGSISLPSNHLVVNPTGRVAANIKAKTIEVSGIVEGDLVGGEVVKINTSGKMIGNIAAPRIVLQDGSKFKGMIDMETSSVQHAPPPAKPSPLADTARSKSTPPEEDSNKSKSPGK